MESRRCKNKPKYKVKIEGFAEMQMCGRCLANPHLQHLITIKVARAERGENLEGECEVAITASVRPKRQHAENSP